MASFDRRRGRPVLYASLSAKKERRNERVRMRQASMVNLHDQIKPWEGVRSAMAVGVTCIAGACGPGKNVTNADVARHLLDVHSKACLACPQNACQIDDNVINSDVQENSCASFKPFHVDDDVDHCIRYQSVAVSLSVSPSLAVTTTPGSKQKAPVDQPLFCPISRNDVVPSVEEMNDNMSSDLEKMRPTGGAAVLLSRDSKKEGAPCVTGTPFYDTQVCHKSQVCNQSQMLYTKTSDRKNAVCHEDISQRGKSYTVTVVYPIKKVAQTETSKTMNSVGHVNMLQPDKGCTIVYPGKRVKLDPNIRNECHSSHSTARRWVVAEDGILTEVSKLDKSVCTENNTVQNRRKKERWCDVVVTTEISEPDRTKVIGTLQGGKKTNSVAKERWCDVIPTSDVNETNGTEAIGTVPKWKSDFPAERWCEVAITSNVNETDGTEDIVQERSTNVVSTERWYDVSTSEAIQSDCSEVIGTLQEGRTNIISQERWCEVPITSDVNETGSTEDIDTVQYITTNGIPTKGCCDVTTSEAVQFGYKEEFGTIQEMGTKLVLKEPWRDMTSSEDSRSKRVEKMCTVREGRTNTVPVEDSGDVVIKTEVVQSDTSENAGTVQERTTNVVPTEESCDVVKSEETHLQCLDTQATNKTLSTTSLQATSVDTLVKVQARKGSSVLRCSVCSKMFGRLHCLKVHERLHMQLKSYSRRSRIIELEGVTCIMCGKIYSTRSNLTVHEKVHAGDQSYSCVTCGKSFDRIAEIKLHGRVRRRQKGHAHGLQQVRQGI